MSTRLRSARHIGDRAVLILILRGPKTSVVQYFAKVMESQGVHAGGVSCMATRMNFGSGLKSADLWWHRDSTLHTRYYHKLIFLGP